MDRTTKKGKRNSAQDSARLTALTDLLAQASAILTELGGTPDDADTADETKTAPTKAVGLDQRVAWVNRAVFALNDSRMGEDHDSPTHLPVAVYDDHVIVRYGVSHYRVDYRIGEETVDLAARDAWAKVDLSWIDAAAAPGDDTKSAAATPEDADVVGTAPVDTTTAAAATPEDDGMVVTAPVVMEVKALGHDRIGHYAVIWGNDHTRDLYEEYFTPQTDELDAVFKSIGKIPMLYQHAGDSAIKTMVVGHYDVMQRDDIGLWVEGQITIANKYAEGIKRLRDAKRLGASSGTLPLARRASRSGEITRWPIIEISLTPNPAEPRMVDMPVAMVRGFYTDALGTPLMDAVLTGEDAVKACHDEQAVIERERLTILELEAAEPVR